MTRYTKNAHGHYMIRGKKFEMLEGSRAQVWHGTACKTSGGLEKSDLLMNKNGRIVSKKKHGTAKKDRRLIKAGYGTKKGKFGFVKIGKSKKMRGGYSSSYGALDAAPFGAGQQAAGVPTDPYSMNATTTGNRVMGGGKRKRSSRRRH